MAWSASRRDCVDPGHREVQPVAPNEQHWPSAACSRKSLSHSNHETLGFGILGLGRAAAATVPAIARNPNTRVVAAADTNVEVLEAFRARYEARGYASLQDLCADAEVDAIYVATPTHLHTQHVLTAVAAGKHVIC